MHGLPGEEEDVGKPMNPKTKAVSATKIINLVSMAELLAVLSKINPSGSSIYQFNTEIKCKFHSHVLLPTLKYCKSHF